MSILRFGSGAVLSCILLSLCACSDLTPLSSGSAVARSQWLKALPQAMSEEFCNQSSPLRDCYPLSEADCQEQVVKKTVSCMKRYRAQIPDEMESGDLSTWGKQIGVCANDQMFQLTEAQSGACKTALKSM